MRIPGKNEVVFYDNGVETGGCLTGRLRGDELSPIRYTDLGSDPFYFADSAHQGKVTDWSVLNKWYVCPTPRKWYPRDPILEAAVGNFERSKRGHANGPALFYKDFD